MDPWVGKISWRREWLPTPSFWPEEFQRQRSLVDYSPWGCKESDATDGLSTIMGKILQYRTKLNSENNNCGFIAKEQGGGCGGRKIKKRHQE